MLNTYTRTLNHSPPRVLSPLRYPTLPCLLWQCERKERGSETPFGNVGNLGYCPIQGRLGALDPIGVR